MDFKDERPDDEAVTHYETKQEYLTRIIKPFTRELKPSLMNTTVSYMRMFENAGKSGTSSTKNTPNSQ